MVLKVIFMGTPQFAVPALKKICESEMDIVAVYSQPPRKSNRGMKIEKSPVHEFADDNNLNIRTPSKLDDDWEYFKSLKFDLAIVVAYGQIISKNFLELPEHGFLNIHASILPKWRGAAPIQRSIMNLDEETGISIMKIVEELDSGPVSNVYKIKIDPEQNSQEISEKLSTLAAEKILDNIDDILDDKAKFVDQDHSKATYASKILKAEGKINWSEDAKNINGKINGLYPSPGAFFIYKGERYKILKAEIGNGIGKAGEVISDNLEVACSNNQSIKILEIQRQGKRPQKVSEFMLGSKIKKGSIILNV